MGVNFREIEDKNDGVTKFNIRGILQDELVGTFRGSKFQGIDTSAEPVIVRGVRYFPGKTNLRSTKIGEKTISPEQDGLFSKNGELLHVGQLHQVRKGETRDSFLGPITPIFSNERYLGRNINDSSNDMQNAHWINEQGEPVYINGSAMESEYQMYENTAIGEVMRVNVDKLHGIFANITSEGRVVYVGERDIDLIGKLQNSVFGEVSLLLPRGRGVGSLVDKDLNIIKDWISNITSLQDDDLGMITQMMRAKGNKDLLTFNANQQEIGYSHLLIRNMVKTSEGIFTNTSDGVKNSSGELLFLNHRKVMKLNRGYDNPSDTYNVLYEGEDKATLISGRDLKGKDLY